MQQARAAATAAEHRAMMVTLQRATDRYAAEWETNRCCHGAAVGIPDPAPHSASHADITQLPAEYQALIRQCWDLTSKLRQIVSYSDNPPSACANPPSACAITKDGAAVMVYHVTHTYGWWDGWWHIDALTTLLADGCKTHYTAGKLTAEQRKARGVFR